MFTLNTARWLGTLAVREGNKWERSGWYDLSRLTDDRDHDRLRDIAGGHDRNFKLSVLHQGVGCVDPCPLFRDAEGAVCEGHVGLGDEKRITRITIQRHQRTRDRIDVRGRRTHIGQPRTAERGGVVFTCNMNLNFAQVEFGTVALSVAVSLKDSVTAVFVPSMAASVGVKV